jgi:uncharacterized protein (DUF983 family)
MNEQTQVEVLRDEKGMIIQCPKCKDKKVFMSLAGKVSVCREC